MIKLFLYGSFFLYGKKNVFELLQPVYLKMTLQLSLESKKIVLDFMTFVLKILGSRNLEDVKSILLNKVNIQLISDMEYHNRNVFKF